MKKAKSQILRYLPLAMSAAGFAFSCCLIPAAPKDGETTKSLTEILTTYITVASILSGFSSGISNQFVTSPNENMINLIKERKVYGSFVKRFRRSTILNITGLLAGFIQILFLKLTNCPWLAKWGSVAVITIGSGGIGAFIVSAAVSSKLAELNENLPNEKKRT